MEVLSFLLPMWEELQRSKHFANYFISLLFLLLLLFISLRFTFSLTRSPKTKLKRPPSPPKLPIIGNLHQLGKLPHRSLQALSKKYGPLMHLDLGYTPTLVVSSAGMLKEITKNHDIAFSDRPKSMAADIFFYGCLDVAFTPYSEYWRQARKFFVLELLSLKRALSFGFVKEEETAGLVRKLRDASSRGLAVNLSQMLIATSNNVISRCILGQKYEEDETTTRFGELSKRAMSQFTAFNFRDFFPYLSWMDVVTGLVSSLHATFRELDPFLEKVIEDHKAALSDKDEQSSDNKKDIVDILLQLQIDGGLDMELTNVNLKAILLDLFVAGSDTISATMEWTMAELMRNKSMMKRAQEEVRRVVGKKSSIDVSDINQMNYLKCVIKETLRLHPAAVIIFRETTESVKLGGYDIAPKTRVIYNVWAVQRDPNFWDRAEEFVPERFENSQVDFRGQDFQLVPFGVGRRGCPGVTFAMFVVEYVIANLLYWFDWKLPDENNETPKNLDMDETVGLTKHRKNPLVVVPIPIT
ncbi:phenylacetaldehyde oxime monooxygenase CYP71AN24-like [Ziziphus jujuba]|uniref:Phenylacetaldehyde oxime monooxygenase CYP71AN24-like n=1 Tax=Ziziphus jujuba TaxID=326968 RepID=A0ABM3IK96_ZIZJJ|nr:phenylacetaldehyde oxime monooxygenase CYP71AN24-like [Ziziphus jujuba]